MKSGWIIRVLMLSVLLIVIALNANALDYPHFEINNIGCDSCHFIYGTEPTLLPPWTAHTPQNIDDTQHNGLCWSCHNDTDAPYVRTHSSLQTDNGYGNWTVECRVCHNPHYQKQKEYGSSGYLFSGTSTSVTATTIQKTGAGWTTDVYENLVVMPNISQNKYIYKITGNTGDTLTVQGPMDLTKVTTGNTFAILYGNLINKTIDLSKITITPAKSGSKTTRFFRTTGSKSFADGDATYDGICEVCHTQTTHFRNNGSGSNQLHTNVGTPAGTNCTTCHSHENGFRHGGGGGTGCGDASSCHGTRESHPTHVGGSGMQLSLACSECHDTDSFPKFKDGEDLANTTACDPCHSPGGTYDGVNNANYGVKNNWTSGVYSGSALKAGKEKWCATCHDESPSVIQTISAPNVVGDEDELYTYGTGWGFYKTGHGLASSSTYPASGGVTAGAGKECLDCHDMSLAHIDGNARTFGSACTPDEYRQGYRLKLIGGQNPMLVPWPQNTGNSTDNYRLCNSCHSFASDNPFTTLSTVNTNLVTKYGDLDPPVNRHEYHLVQNSYRYSADWGGSCNSRMTCSACHNVHGSTRLAMVRDGKLGLGGAEPGLQIWYYNSNIVDFDSPPDTEPTPSDVPLAASTGTVWSGGSSSNLCSHCHGNVNLTVETRTPFQDLTQVPTLDWTGENGYVSDGVDPNSAKAESAFEFRVEYTDKNNDAPVFYEVWVDMNDSGDYNDYGEKVAMSEVITTDPNYTNGKLYAKTISLSKEGDNNFNYRFYFSDGQVATGPPASDSIVTLTNNLPTLSWTGEAYFESNGVNPDRGGIGGNYEFRIKYTDADINECPASGSSGIQVWIDENNNGYEAGEKHNLVEADALDTDCRDGKIYKSTRSLSTAGAHNYRFYATDGYAVATINAGPVNDNVVTVSSSANNPPELTWVTEDCRTNGVKPARGLATGNFEFKVKYTDLDNQCPPAASDIQVVVDGTAYNLTPGAGSCDTGRIYSVTLQLNTAGDLTYYFKATDGTDTATGDPVSGAGNEVTVVSTANAKGVRTGSSDSGPVWYNSIQSAAATASFKTILVYEGTYNENLSFNSSPTYDGITLESVCGPDLTTINASVPAGYTIFIQNVDNYTTIDGFTIMGGQVGLFINNNTGGMTTLQNSTVRNNNLGVSSPNASNRLTIDNTVIRNNSGSLAGGGVFLNNYGGPFIITNSTIKDNSTTLPGGGLFLQNIAYGDITITNSTITGNSAGGNGGGIYSNNANPIIDKTVISSNTSSGDGGGMFFQGSGALLTLTNSNFIDNTANSQGGGLYLNSGLTANITNCTFSDNKLTDTTTGLGGGIYENLATTTIKNTIFWNNTAAGKKSGHELYTASGPFDIYNSLLLVNIYTLGKGSGTFNIDPSCIDDDPQFVGGAPFDYHLKSVSPAIDQGTATGAPADDIDGDTRTGSIDIGSDEYISEQAGGDNIIVSNLAQIQSGNVDAGQTNAVMLRFQVDCDNSGNGICLLSTITTGDSGTAGAGDWNSLEIYIDADTNFSGSTRIGQAASWDGTSTNVTLDQGTQADRTVTNGTSKYIFIVYNLTEAAEGETIQSGVTAMGLTSPDNGVSGLGYASGYISINADSLSTSNNTAVQAVDPNVGDQNVVMQRFQADCGTAGNNSCILSTITVDDLGTASTGDWDNLEIYIDTDTSFTGSTRIGQAASWDGASTAVTLNQGTTADRTVTNGTSKYIFIVYDINSGAGGVTIQSRVTAVGVSSPDTGVTGLAYNSNLLTVQGASADSLSTSEPATVRTGYADIGESSLVMQRFKVDCDNSADGSCLLSSVTVDDLGTASSGDWDYLQVFIDTDTSFAGAVKIGESASWNGASTAVSTNLGTVADRTVTYGTSKYVFIVYDLSSSIASGDTLNSRVTAIGVTSPDNGVTGLTYDSNQLTVTDAISVYGTCGVACIATTTGQCCNTITQAITRNDSATRPIIVYDGTYSESVNLMNKSNRYLQSANGPESTIIAGGTYSVLLQTSYTITLDGFSHIGSSYGIQANGNTSATIRNCDIYNNTSRGINVSSGTNVTLSVSSCDIYSNSGSSAGVGIYLNGGTITVENSKIFGNSTTGNGGALNMQNANTTFRNVMITGNTGYDGGAAYFNSGTFYCYNCTVSGNKASNVGGGFRVATATLTLRNSIVYNNDATSQGDELYLVSGTTSLDYSFIKTGAPYIQGNVSPTLTNIISDDTNLLFVEKRDPSEAPTPLGNYHLRANSPCINSGTSTDAVSPDIDGDTRPQGGGYDMGADEYVP